MPPAPDTPLFDPDALWLTTREAAALLGKSPANVRARASKGDFGATQPGPDGLPRYHRDRVAAVGERMAARAGRTAASPETALPPAASLLAALQAQCAEHSARCSAWVDEARAAARQAQAEAQELREVLRQREETTRETLTHMDLLHDQNITHLHESLAAERAGWAREQQLWARERAAQDAEIARLTAQLTELLRAAPEKSRAPWRK